MRTTSAVVWLMMMSVGAAADMGVEVNRGGLPLSPAGATPSSKDDAGSTAYSTQGDAAWPAINRNTKTNNPALAVGVWCVSFGAPPPDIECVLRLDQRPSPGSWRWGQINIASHPCSLAIQRYPARRHSNRPGSLSRHLQVRKVLDGSELRLDEARSLRQDDDLRNLRASRTSQPLRFRDQNTRNHRAAQPSLVKPPWGIGFHLLEEP